MMPPKSVLVTVTVAQYGADAPEGSVFGKTREKRVVADEGPLEMTDADASNVCGVPIASTQSGFAGEGFRFDTEALDVANTFDPEKSQ